MADSERRHITELVIHIFDDETARTLLQFFAENPDTIKVIEQNFILEGTMAMSEICRIVVRYGESHPEIDPARITRINNALLRHNNIVEAEVVKALTDRTQTIKNNGKLGLFVATVLNFGETGLEILRAALQEEYNQ